MTTWDKAQEFEADWHNKISTNSFHEEEKQLVYANRMGIEIYPNAYTPYNIKNYGRVLDIGGGDASLLLKVENPEDCVVVDPCKYPQWTIDRYNSKGIEFLNIKAEDYILSSGCQPFEEIWLYNCLQHTENPGKIINNAKNAGKIIRIFEWIETGTNVGHIHNLTKEKLDKWLGGEGKVEQLNEHGCYGLAYYGVFLGNIK